MTLKLFPAHLLSFSLFIAALFFVAVEAAASPLSDAQNDPTRLQRSEPEFYYGVGTHFGMSRHSEKQLFSTIRQAGLNSLRDDVSWRILERERRGTYDARYLEVVVGNPLRKGIIPLPVLAYGNKLYGGNGTYPHNADALEGYAKYCEFVVSYFKSRVPVYEIWNEWGANPDPKTGPSTAEDYAKLLAYVVPRLRKIDPNAKFITGWRDEQSLPSRSGTYPQWINKFLEAGCLEHLDGYSSHPYGYRDPDRRYPEDLPQRLSALQNLLQKYNNGKQVPIYVTELGWPTNTGKWGMQPAGQTDVASRAFLVARTIPYVRGLWFYNIQDDGYGHEYNENNFGLLRPDGTPKPGYWGMSGVVNEIKDFSYVGRKAIPNEDIWLLEFKTPEGSPVWAAWTLSREYQYQIVFESSSLAPDSQLRITPAGRPSFVLPFGYREWVNAKNKHTLQNKANANQVSVSLSTTPLFIRGPLASLKIVKIEKHAFPTSDSPTNIGNRYPDAIAVSQGIQISNDAFLRSALAQKQNLLKNRPAISLPVEKPTEPEAVTVSARFACFHSADTLFIAVNVKDPVHYQKQSGELAWQEDSLQLAFQSHPFGYISDSEKTTSLSISLVNGNVDIYRHASELGLPPGPDSDVKAQVTREKDNTFYLVSIPATAINLRKIIPNSHIGFSLLINNNDGKGRTWLGWGGDGIVRGTNPQMYNWLTFSAPNATE